MVVPSAPSAPDTPVEDLPLAHPPSEEDGARVPEEVIALAAELRALEQEESDQVKDLPAVTEADTPANRENRETDNKHVNANAIDTKDTKGKATMGRLQLILSAVVAALWVVHTSPWIYMGAGTKPLPESLGLVPNTHYMTLDRAFWSAILAGLAVALLVEGISRRRVARRDEELPDV
jgi:hypothetical protein